LIDLYKAREILGRVNVKNVKMKLVSPTPKMQEFLRLSELGIAVDVVNGERPAIVLDNGVTIIYNAIPLGMEYEPFVRTMARIAKQDSDLKKGNLKKLAGKGEVVVFIAPFCPHCARVVETANKIAIANPKIRVRIVDVSLFPELGERFNITSAPTVVINEEIKLIGELDEDELVEWLRRASGGHKLEYFVTLLRDGRIEEVMEALNRNPEDVALVGGIIEQPELMARVGAMILLERLFRDNPDKVRIARDRILKILESGDSVKVQDAAFILGKIGRKEDIPALESLLKSEDSEIREAVREAVEEIKSRSRKFFN